MSSNSNKTPALSTNDDDAYQTLQGEYWAALGRHDQAEAKRIQGLISDMRAGKRGTLAETMSKSK